ncbi:MAG: hypothetical protein IT343_22670 [Candidatus Melainabacteria bacterium]|nr:hypothetical protein [Candidatus Melainabacteria bacterium]
MHDSKSAVVIFVVRDWHSSANHGVGDLSKSKFMHCGRTHNRFGRAIAMPEQHQNFQSFEPNLSFPKNPEAEALLNQFISRKGQDKDLCGKQGLKSKN